TVTNSDRAVLERLDVHGHAPGRPDLVLAPIELADCRRVVVDRHDLGLQVVADAATELDDLGPLLQQRQHRHLVWREIRMEGEDDSLLAPDLFLAVTVDEKGECRPIGTTGRFDDPRNEMLFGGRVEILEVLAGRPLMVREVEVAAIVDALELLPA